MEYKSSHSTQCGNYGNLPPLQKTFREINLYYNSLVKKYLEKNFWNYHTVQCSVWKKREILSYQKIKFVKSTL